MGKRHHGSRNKAVEHSYFSARSQYEDHETFMDSMERSSRKEAKRRRDAARNRFDDYEPTSGFDNDDYDQVLDLDFVDDD